MALLYFNLILSFWIVLLFNYYVTFHITSIPPYVTINNARSTPLLPHALRGLWFELEARSESYWFIAFLIVESIAISYNIELIHVLMQSKQNTPIPAGIGFRSITRHVAGIVPVATKQPPYLCEPISTTFAVKFMNFWLAHMVCARKTKLGSAQWGKAGH